MNLFVNKIRKEMESIEISVSALAQAAGFSRTYMTDVLRGRYIPKDDRIYAIAQVLGLNPKDLISVAKEARAGIKADRPTRSFKFLEQRRAKSLAEAITTLGVDCSFGDYPPLLLKLNKKSYAVLFTQTKADHRFTLGCALELKERDKLDKVYVIPELRTEDDIKYSDLMKKYGVFMLTAEELMSELKSI